MKKLIEEAMLLNEVRRNWTIAVDGIKVDYQFLPNDAAIEIFLNYGTPDARKLGRTIGGHFSSRVPNPCINSVYVSINFSEERDYAKEVLKGIREFF